jgi:alpha-L-rhamnosidase
MAWLATREENGLPRFGIGDWVYYKTVTPSDYTTSAYYYYDLKQMVYFAELLGKDAKPWADKAAAALAQLNEEYYDAATGTYSTGTMAAQAVALWLELVPAGGEQKVADVLAAKLRENDHKVDFGMLGSKTVLRMLTRYGYVQDAFRLASQTGSPGWLNWVGEKGHTTLPETWTLDEGNKDASLNHVFLGDIVAWLVNDIAGIAHDGRGTGFRHFVVAPHFVKGLDWAKAEYNSVRGMIRSQWVRQGGKVTLTVEVPVGSTATLRLDGKESTLPAGVHNITVDEK